MSRATKRKHVVKEVEDGASIPTSSQSIVQIVKSRGNNLHEVVNSASEQCLVSMPTKFRHNIWIKKGNFVLVEPISEGDKVKAEIVKILRKEDIKWYRAQNVWPQEFDKFENEDQTNGQEGKLEDELFVNTNRLPTSSKRVDSESESDTSSDGCN